MTEEVKDLRRDEGTHQEAVQVAGRERSDEVPEGEQAPRRKPQREPSQHETAMSIADQLGETSDPARSHIVYLVKALGRTQSRRLRKEAFDLEERGGMMMLDGSRRRTPGEVFFHLAETRGKPKRDKALKPFADTATVPEEHPGLPSHQEVAQKIAERLSETDLRQRQQIEQIVWALGQVQAWALMLDAIEVDEGEGMLIPNGSRRRTVGGIFFYLVYNHGVPLEGRTLQRTYGQGKQPARSMPRVEGVVKEPEVISPLVWEDRIAVIREAEEMKGTANVKITVVGRPGKVVDRGQCVVTIMESNKVPALPKGLPTPPVGPTKYTVYIGSKQWKKVAEAIRDPEDVLIVEGFPTIDTQTGSIAVFATNTTTKHLQMAQKEAQKAKTETAAS